MSTPPLSRRSLLHWVGALGAGTAAAACGERKPEVPSFDRALDKPPVPGAERFGTFEEKWVNTACGQCPAGCGIRVRVVEGRAVRIEGNPSNPINRGGIGPRGLAGLQALYDADRLTGPMRRVNGTLVPVSWEEALRELSERLAALRTKGEAHRLLVWSGGERGMLHELFARFAQAFGTPNFVEGGRTSVIAQAMATAVGTYTQPTFDWGGARYVLSLEAGLLEDSCQSVYFTRAAAELRRGHRGDRAKIVHVGPTYDLCAHNADEWIQIVPGTSGALALGIAHALVRDNRFDQEVVLDRSEAFDELAAALADYTPAQVADLTGVPAATIERLATEMADSGGAFAVVDERSLGFANGLATAHAAMALDALLGGFGGREGGVMIEPTPPYAAWPDVALDALATAGLARPRLDGAGGPEFPGARSVHERLPDALSGPDAPEVMLLLHANPAWARAQPARWHAALAKVPLLVSFSPFLDETVADHAHLVLPDHTYLERWEDAASAPGVGRAVAGVRVPVVAPLHDTLAAGDALLRIAHQLGGAVAAALPWGTFAEAMEARLVGLYEARRGSIEAKGAREFIEHLYRDGFWTDLGTAPEPRRVRFTTSWTPPTWDGDAASFPLLLLPYRPLGYAEGSGANQPWLRMLQSRAHQRAFTTPATMHPDDAAGLTEGDLITLTSPHGAIEVPVLLDPRMRRGCVAVPMGGGHTAFGRWAAGVGANVMQLVAPGPAAESGANAVCTTRVRMSRRAG